MVCVVSFLLYKNSKETDLLKTSKLLKKVRLNDEKFLQEIDKIVNESNGIIHVNEFTEESAKQFYTEFNKAIKFGQTLIPILVDSYGGQLDSLNFMIDLIDASPVPVSTFCLGKAMSCGAILLSCGNKGLRFAAPNSRIMLHSVASGVIGKQLEMKNSAEETERVERLIYHRFAKNCNKKPGHFLDIFKKRGDTDWFLSATDAKKLGIVDFVKVPQFSTEVVVENIIS